MKLTPKQNMIINCLQNGWILITNSHSSVITCATDRHQFEFSSTLFYKLVNMGLIAQGGYQERFDWGLTVLGKNTPTKDVQKAIKDKIFQ